MELDKQARLEQIDLAESSELLLTGEVLLAIALSTEHAQHASDAPPSLPLGTDPAENSDLQFTSDLRLATDLPH